MSEKSDDPLFDRLARACVQEWRAFSRHAFILQLAAGTLPKVCFQHYLKQDYLFLIHFARAYGLAAYKGETVDDIKGAAAGLSAMMSTEMRMHLAYCAEWGVKQSDMEQTEEADATLAYTRYVLERGLSGDLLDLWVALAPCIIGYAKIGTQLIKDEATVLDGNPYRAWIEMYASDDYQEIARIHIRQLDDLMRRRGGPGRMRSLTTTFRQATRLETAFWEMGLQPSKGSG